METGYCDPLWKKLGTFAYIKPSQKVTLVWKLIQFCNHQHNSNCWSDNKFYWNIFKISKIGNNFYWSNPIHHVTKQMWSDFGFYSWSWLDEEHWTILHCCINPSFFMKCSLWVSLSAVWILIFKLCCDKFLYSFNSQCHSDTFFACRIFRDYKSWSDFLHASRDNTSDEEPISDTYEKGDKTKHKDDAHTSD